MKIPARIAHKLIAGDVHYVRLPLGPQQRLNDGRKVPGRCPYAPGDDHPVIAVSVETVQVEGSAETYTVVNEEELDGRVRIITVEQAPLATGLTYDQAKREGYRTGAWLDDLLETWETHYRGGNPDRTVWLLTVEPHVDTVRRLTYTGRPVGKVDPLDPDRWHGPDGSETGYTTGPHAMSGEPEAVDPATISPIRLQADRQRHQDATREHQTDRQGRNLAQRLREELKAASRSGIDLSDNLATIARELEQMRARREQGHPKAA